jgi:hypothetical protein
LPRSPLPNQMTKSFLATSTTGKRFSLDSYLVENRAILGKNEDEDVPMEESKEGESIQIRLSDNNKHHGRPFVVPFAVSVANAHNSNNSNNNNNNTFVYDARQRSRKPILVLDIDHTLVETVRVDFQLQPLKLEQGYVFRDCCTQCNRFVMQLASQVSPEEGIVYSCASSLATKMNQEEDEAKVAELIRGTKQELFYVKLRPQVHNFLQHLSQTFQLFLYTMSARYYAEAILKLLDPSTRLFGNPRYSMVCRDDFANHSEKSLMHVFNRLKYTNNSNNTANNNNNTANTANNNNTNNNYEDDDYNNALRSSLVIVDDRVDIWRTKDRALVLPIDPYLHYAANFNKAACVHCKESFPFNPSHFNNNNNNSNTSGGRSFSSSTSPMVVREQNYFTHWKQEQQQDENNSDTSLIRTYQSLQFLVRHNFQPVMRNLNLLVIDMDFVALGKIAEPKPTAAIFSETFQQWRFRVGYLGARLYHLSQLYRKYQKNNILDTKIHRIAKFGLSDRDEYTQFFEHLRTTLPQIHYLVQLDAEPPNNQPIWLTYLVQSVCPKGSLSIYHKSWTQKTLPAN